MSQLAARSRMGCMRCANLLSSVDWERDSILVAYIRQLFTKRKERPVAGRHSSLPKAVDGQIVATGMRQARQPLCAHSCATAGTKSSYLSAGRSKPSAQGDDARDCRGTCRPLGTTAFARELSWQVLPGILLQGDSGSVMQSSAGLERLCPASQRRASG